MSTALHLEIRLPAAVAALELLHRSHAGKTLNRLAIR